MLLQILTGILLGLHYTSEMNYAYYSVMHIIREVYFGWCFRYIHSSGASFIFIFIFLHIGRALYYGSYFYISNTWISGIFIFILLMASAFMGYVLPWGQMSFIIFIFFCNPEIKTSIFLIIYILVYFLVFQVLYVL